ncbi:TIGR03621 family F420-dependent LLM class oxidoreductase [Nocardia sp. CA2R105]|uniref:TIGR03621 family F420-dependent LLM class oxidoreductase n=1 Tax=Nocardia coffeae TaxID=2873381 RepID=UPI001CA65C4E|nr:TIGR03621 family F420-dependent LLM class oxidoreductase [Nocardia coffeae]MBY8863346.1 TIGR03621 family F420-dependent LLM class oxidoreductase [Nocardia coffeae]
MSSSFRFGVNMFLTDSKKSWIEKCRKAEDSGFDVLGVADHLGFLAPLPAMLLAAEATERAQVNSFVLNVPFYNPTLLAREVATLDLLTDGRVELGLGAGYVKSEFDAAAIEFPSAGRRVQQVADTARTLRTTFADPDYRPRPARAGGPPLLIAGWGERMLRVAAEHADVVAFTGGRATDSGLITAGTPEDLDQRVAAVREALGPRRESTEFNILIQQLAAPNERAALLERLAPNLPEGAAERAEEIPMLLVGTPAQMADQIRERHTRYGISYFTVLEPNMDKMARVIELLR